MGKRRAERHASQVARACGAEQGVRPVSHGGVESDIPSLVGPGNAFLAEAQVT